MAWIDLVAVLAVAQLFFFSVMVGQARGRYKVAAPAVTGHEMFERAYRVQMNTMELIVILLPVLYIAGRYWSGAWVPAAGAVYLIGRFIYWRAYISNPASRSLGFGLSAGPIAVLMLAALAGAIRSLL